MKMRAVTDFEAYGTVFHFEPPVIVEEEPIGSLSRLAAIALVGSGANHHAVRSLEHHIDPLIEHRKDNPAAIAVALTDFLRPEYTVTIA